MSLGSRLVSPSMQILRSLSSRANFLKQATTVCVPTLNHQFSQYANFNTSVEVRSAEAPVDRTVKGGKRLRRERRQHNKEHKGEKIVHRDEPHPLPEPSVPYEAEDLVPGPGMLRRIVRALESQGTTIILPSDEELVEQLSWSLKYLCDIGVRPEFLLSACESRPRLFTLLTKHGRPAVEMAEVLVEMCAFTYEDSLRMLSSYPDELLGIGAAGIQARLDAVTTCGVGHGKQLGRVARLCPALLFSSDPQTMLQTAESIGAFFSRKQVAAVVSRCPQVLLRSVDELEEKYEYIFYQMCIEGDEFKDCSQWAEMPLDEIIRRHEFLLKCGRYTTPDKKNPQIKMENPPLHRVLDSSDEHFAVQVAGVTPEEWTIYRGLEAKEADLANKERPFEKIKPSMRKAFERRYKEALKKQEHVFDTTTTS